MQEEPANMGAWPRMALKLPELLGRPVRRISLPPSSAPAGGSATLHASEHRALIEAALGAGGAARPAGPGGRRVTCRRAWAAVFPQARSVCGAAGDGHGRLMYFTDRGIEKLEEQRGDDQVSLAWVAERLREFVDLNPESEAAVDRLAGWLAAAADDED